MAIVTKDNEETEPMADDAEQDRPEPSPFHRPPTLGTGGGFFSIYKPGQGYWTRICTAGGAVVVLALMAQFIFTSIITRANNANTSIVGGVVAAVAVAAAVIMWHYFNKPTVVDFFIATESEMKKVNWTSRKDLIGSTKVVIVFMFLTAGLLFLIDVFFGYFFWLIKVLKQGPFG
jgi:preprotein translocase SecE subunit